MGQKALPIHCRKVDQRKPRRSTRRLHKLPGGCAFEFLDLAAANPYDPHYTKYFEKRRSFAWRVRWGGRTAIEAAAAL